MSFIHVQFHVAYYLPYLNRQVLGTYTVAVILIGLNYIQTSLHCSAVMTSRLVKCLIFKKYFFSAAPYIVSSHVPGH